MTEADFQAKVIDLAHYGGWWVHHDRPARTATGWATHIQGDAGFPDLVLAHPALGIVFAELKAPKGVRRAEQDAWLRTLNSEPRHTTVHLWRPDDWSEIVARLTPGATIGGRK